MHAGTNNMSGRYAEGTSVSVEKSQAEIKSLLMKYGAAQYATADDITKGQSMVQFQAQDRVIRFVVSLPSPDEKRFKLDGRGNIRKPEARTAAWEQGCRQKWRALALCIKAKLEAVASGISEFEEEFLAHIVLPGNETVSQWLRPQLKIAYENKQLPEGIAGLLPAPRE